MRSNGASGREALVLTLDPAMGGGVRTMQRAVCAALERMGLEPHLAFARSGRRERLDLRVREGRADGRPSLSVGYLPSIEFANYVVPAARLRRHLRRFAFLQVVSGVHSVSLVPILGRQRFVSWVATPFLDEIESRAAAESPSTSVRWNHALRRINAAIERRSLKRADAVLALSTYTARRFAERTGLPLERFPVLRCPVDTARYTPDGPRWATGPTRYVVSVGRVDDERKNFGALVRTFARVAERHPDVDLVIVGECSEPSPVRRLAAELGVADRVHFPGILEGDELPAAYRGADLFVLTSRQEGLGIVILEAQASGTAPVVMRCGGGEELVRDGVDGWLTPAGDEDAFAAALDHALADGQARDAASLRARERVVAESSAAVFTDALRAVYARVWPERVGVLAA